MHYKLAISIVMLILVLSVGTEAYHQIEGWGYIDSLYFSVITVSTIGYGNGIYPVTDEGKLFTVVYLLMGVSTAFTILYSVSAEFLENRYMRKFEHSLMMSQGDVKYGKNRKFHELRKMLIGE